MSCNLATYKIIIQLAVWRLLVLELSVESTNPRPAKTAIVGLNNGSDKRNYPPLKLRRALLVILADLKSTELTPLNWINGKRAILTEEVFIVSWHTHTYIIFVMGSAKISHKGDNWLIGFYTQLKRAYNNLHFDIFHTLKYDVWFKSYDLLKNRLRHYLKITHTGETARWIKTSTIDVKEDEQKVRFIHPYWSKTKVFFLKMWK